MRRTLTVHPGDRVVTLYVLADGRYGAPEIVEMKDRTALTIVPEIEIAWDALVARLSPPEV